MERNPSLVSLIESLLFVAGQPLSYAQIAKILETDNTLVQEVVVKLKNEYQANDRGVRIVTNNHNIELVTAPDNFSVIQRLVAYEQTALSQSKIETLTILAYQGPLTKAELENIRGVNCSLILKNLKTEDLIDDISENNLLKYQVSTKFLKALGISSVSDLPNYEDWHQS